MGVLLALLGAFSFSLMNVFVRNGVRPSDGDTGFLTTVLINVALYAVLMTVMVATGGLGQLEPAGVAWFVLAGLAATFFGRLALFGAISHIGAARGAAIKNATPLVAVGIALLVLGEELTHLAALGIALIAVALGLLVWESLTREGGPGTARSEPVTEALESEAVADGWWGRTRSAADRTIAAMRAPSRHTVLFGVALGVVAALSFGTGHVFRKLGMDVVPNALVGATIGATTALLASLAMSAARGRLGDELRSTFASHRPWVWAAGVAGTGGQLSFFAALAFAPVSHVSAVSGSETVLTVLCTAALARRPEAITLKIVVPAVLMFGGTALIGLGG